MGEFLIMRLPKNSNDHSKNTYGLSFPSNYKAAKRSNLYPVH